MKTIRRLTDAIGNWNWFKKKPLHVRAIQFGEDSEVHTDTGVAIGKKGDYLIEGIKGELYPCKRNIFKQTYDPANQYKKEIDSNRLMNWFDSKDRKESGIAFTEGLLRDVARLMEYAEKRQPKALK